MLTGEIRHQQIRVRDNGMAAGDGKKSFNGKSLGLVIKSQPAFVRRSPILTAFLFEYDRVNKILLTRIAGRFTDQLLKECEQETRKHVRATSARAQIVDCSAITEYAVSSELVRSLAMQEPVVPGGRQLFVVPSAVGFGLARMFQILGEPQAAQVTVVRTLDGAFKELGVEDPRFEPLE